MADKKRWVAITSDQFAAILGLPNVVEQLNAAGTRFLYSGPMLLDKHKSHADSVLAIAMKKTSGDWDYLARVE